MAEKNQPAKAHGKNRKAERAQPAADASSRSSEAATNGSRPPPRLRRYYEKQVRPQLQQEFGFSSPMQVPKLEKIVINVGVGEATKNPKLLDSVVAEVARITGQKPLVRRAKKAISNFGLREGMPVGVSVTLRRERMYEFLDRLINVAFPRVRDFRGLTTRSFDGRGNYTVGVKEQVIFPEIDIDKVEKIHGMDITIVTSTDRDDEGLALLRALGMPFRGDTPVVVVPA